MLKLHGLVSAIQTAVDRALKMASDENYKLLNTYFDNVTPKEEIENDKTKASTSEKNKMEHLVPKMVAMEFPIDSSNGAKSHTVMVPLITLVPFSYLQISELDLEMELEIQKDGDDVVVGFPRKGLLGGSDKGNAKVTIKVDTSQKQSGIHTIIEGYEKALRGQIPG